MKKGLVLFLIAVMVLGVIATGCAPAPTDVNGNVVDKNSTPEPIGKEMTLVGQSQYVQVYRMTDNVTGVICYVTIDHVNYDPSSIFCIH
jgi:hypothetical protein